MHLLIEIKYGMSTLELVNGYSAISDNGFVRIVPENEATRDLNFALDEGLIMLLR